MNRQYIGIDLSDNYNQIAIKRIEKSKNQKNIIKPVKQ